MTGRSHLSEVASPEEIVREILELDDSPSPSNSNRSKKLALLVETPCLPDEFQRPAVHDISMPGVGIKERPSSPGSQPTGAVYKPAAPIMAPLSPVHAPGAHYFTPCDLGAVPASNIKLRDHSSCETLRIEQTQPESTPREDNDQPKTAPESPRLWPKLRHLSPPVSLHGTPLLGPSKATIEAGLERNAFQCEPLTPAHVDVATGAKSDGDTRATSPLEVLEPREGASGNTARVLGDIDEVLNGKNSLPGMSELERMGKITRR